MECDYLRDTMDNMDTPAGADRTTPHVEHCFAMHWQENGPPTSSLDSAIE